MKYYIQWQDQFGKWQQFTDEHKDDHHGPHH